MKRKFSLRMLFAAVTTLAITMAVVRMIDQCHGGIAWVQIQWYDR